MSSIGILCIVEFSYNSHQYFLSSARADKNVEVFLPALQFGEKRYFGQVWPFIESEETRLINFIQLLIWSGVVEFIPSSPLEGVFDVPQVVSGLRNLIFLYLYV